jgi:glycosyltransferase involved in cell wall biosynthesis
MKIVLVHNHYQQQGGEDAVFADEAGLLEARGHEVIRYTLHNDTIADMSRWQVAQRTLWNRKVYRELRSLFRCERPAVMHCTNTFPLVSPAAYYAASAAGVPVVQSLHNYRLLCVNSLFMRDGKVCESCLGKRVAWQGVLHRCYRDSRSGSAVVAALQAVHRTLGTWTRKVDAYIALTQFAREKFIVGGLPADKLFVKPNFVSPDPGLGSGRGGYGIFVARLSPEKGIETLISAWQGLPSAAKLKIVGDGPCREAVIAAAKQNPNIEWLGHQPREKVQALMAEAAFLAIPSNWFEGLPKTILEAFAVGTPVVGSRLGGIAEAVSHARTGRLFTAGDEVDLRTQIQTLLSDPPELAAMRLRARREFELKYTADRNYEMLIGLYSRLAKRGSKFECESESDAVELAPNPIDDESVCGVAP